MTYSEFIEKLTLKNEHYKNNKFKIISTKIVNYQVFTENQFGKCVNSVYVLLKGSNVNIDSALSKTEYFKNQLYFYNDNYKNGLFQLIDEYKAIKSFIKIKTKHGICSVYPDDLLNNIMPTIQSAVNPTEYFISMAREVHGDKYDYSESVYINMKKDVKIICPIHGIFEKTPNNHIFSKLKCKECNKNINKIKNEKKYRINNRWTIESWIRAAKISKNFDSFKLYVIRCWNDKEVFTKIGITFQSIEKRFYGNISMPYNYKIVKIIESKNPYLIFNLEQLYHIKFNKYKYTPKIKFGGISECFKFKIT